MKKFETILTIGFALVFSGLMLMSSITADKPQIDYSPTILIYHTHNAEAYKASGQYSYTDEIPFYIDDSEKNISVIGKELAHVLTEDYGYEVLYVVANYELKDAYKEARKTLEAYWAKYPSIKVAIDLHRDVADVAIEGNADIIKADGADMAKCLFVVGKGNEKVQGGYLNPNFDANKAWATAVAGDLQKIDSNLASLSVKNGIYNQDLFERSLFINVGNNNNIMEEALATVPYLAAAIDSALK